MKNTEERIRTIINDAVIKLFSLIADGMNRPSFDSIVKTTQEAMNSVGVRLVEEVVRITDEEYNAKRDIHAVTLRNLKTRKMISGMGELSLTRRLYFNKASQKYFFAADQLLHIEKYSRIERELKAKLIGDATLTSYGKASKLSKNCVSRQTVYNLVKKVPSKSLDVQAKGFKQVQKIYIEADEDHIHLNNGQSAEIKLVYVHEGRRRVNRGRTELMNAKYFVSASKGTQIWDYVSDYLFNQYAVSKAEVHLSGDGAAWIKQGLEVIPKVKYHIDKFHVFESITRATGNDTKLRRQIINCIRTGEREKMKTLYVQRWKGLRSVRQRRRLTDSLTYVYNNFRAIDLTQTYCCSAEGHVSHVLSSRLSSRPMAWSRRGAEKMAKLRAYYFNGGNFDTRLCTEIENTKKKYNKFATHEVESVHEIPRGRVVGLDGITDEVSRILRSIVR